MNLTFYVAWLIFFIALSLVMGYQFALIHHNWNTAKRIEEIIKAKFPDVWSAYKQGVHEGYEQGLRDGQELPR